MKFLIEVAGNNWGETCNVKTDHWELCPRPEVDNRVDERSARCAGLAATPEENHQLDVSAKFCQEGGELNLRATHESFTESDNKSRWVPSIMVSSCREHARASSSGPAATCSNTPAVTSNCWTLITDQSQVKHLMMCNDCGG